MRSLRDLMDAHHHAGRLDWIGLRPARRADMAEVDAVDIADGGPVGDHARPGKRAVTLIQAEHLPVIAALSRTDAGPGALRRNLVVSGLNLATLRGRDLRIGTAVLHVTGPCAPCSRMEDTLGPGGYQAVRHHGGWCASVVTPGRIARGDAVTPC
ncbi:MOSC domain-containing protein [uncultured Jannaschia sp.]|uniref:MOSC domain-containing protein n=1 Tax=uncultured Jannaschia sp. TaxID=293347 RepID=UPI00261070A4|nr:MOSC domain-containing protein [uncultured Jannaschia sp.]